MQTRRTYSPETMGLILGFIGTVAFSLTFPATKLAVAALHPTVVGLGRAVVAAALAGSLLLLTRQRRPRRDEIGGLLVVVAGVIFAFPLLSAWALRRVPSAHGAVIIGLLPLATAIAGTIRVGERPSLKFWLASVAGSAAVVGYAVYDGAGSFQLADLALLGAVIGAAIAYAEGARLARTLGSWQVICWALVLAIPLLIIPTTLAVREYGLVAPFSAWAGFAYVAVVSQFLAFFAWYRGLALGGVARVGQMQLFQPFLTLFESALLLGETITLPTVGFALLVVASVAWGRTAAVKR